MVVEIIIGCEKKVLTNTEIVVIIIAKLIMSTCLLVVLFYYKRRTILKLSSTLLFEQYEANHLNKIIEVYHFLIDKLMNDDNHYTYFYFINDQYISTPSEAIMYYSHNTNSFRIDVLLY